MNSDRLDRIETDLETVKEILLTSARSAEASDKRAEATDKRIEDLTQSLQEQSRLADERGRKIDARIEDLTQSLQAQSRLANERGRKIDERLDRLSENLNQLREDVDIAFQTISLLSENTDRSMAEFRAETRAIWEYLMRKSQNGDGNV